MFDPSEHLLNVGTKKKPRMYLEVKWRIVWLREQYPEAEIKTEIVHLDLEKEVSAEVSEWNDELGKMEKVTKHGQGLVIFKATIKLPNGAIGTGTKMENAAAFGDFLEKAETGAIGRALASLGLGTATTDEMSEGTGHVVDAPVERKPSYDPNQPATQSQYDTAHRLQKQLGLAESEFDGLLFGDMANMIKDLNKRLQERRKAS
jgi:hypothetical protein